MEKGQMSDIPMDGLLEGLICCNCEQCKPNMKRRPLGGVMCEECFQGYEEMERERRRYETIKKVHRKMTSDELLECLRDIDQWREETGR